LKEKNDKKNENTVSPTLNKLVEKKSKIRIEPLKKSNHWF